MTRGQRLSFLLIAAVIAVVAVVALSAGGDGPGGGERAAATATPTPGADDAENGAEATATPTPTPTPRPRPPLLTQGNPRTLRFTEGERIRFRVRANQTDHVHVHGYDRLRDVQAGQTVTFSFPATITGIFEIELEDSGIPLGNLRVDPA